MVQGGGRVSVYLSLKDETREIDSCNVCPLFTIHHDCALGVNFANYTEEQLQAEVPTECPLPDSSQASEAWEKELVDVLHLVDSYYYQPYVDQHGLTEERVRQAVELALKPFRALSAKAEDTRKANAPSEA
jgi:hypothetical protein